MTGEPDARWGNGVFTAGAAPVAVATASVRRAIDPGLVSIMLVGLACLSALLLATALVPGRALALVSRPLAARRSDLAFGGILLGGALALAFLVSQTS